MNAQAGIKEAAPEAQSSVFFASSGVRIPPPTITGSEQYFVTFLIITSGTGCLAPLPASK